MTRIELSKYRKMSLASRAHELHRALSVRNKKHLSPIQKATIIDYLFHNGKSGFICFANWKMRDIRQFFGELIKAGEL